MATKLEEPRQEAKARHTDGGQGWKVPIEKKIKVRIVNIDLSGNEDENVPWSFVFRRPAIRRPDGTMCRFPIISYPLRNNAEYELPESVVVHLESIAYPVRKYKPNQEEGQSIPISGSRRRFTVSRL